ncbi:helix-turn-helix domain-containing protein [Siphonobacter curvatus]|uniref:HTH araC/xylS-type domain-containing protein n=1 Tax=Siphonobacter curvatus TaxID=2094562 RepID=A0A2S7IF31_9BACT|nr:AraC family transcriptional regulator [Siphonobacter curvatus]PQA53427.1 hypothetical protein C5O19_24600 [Siphonobacter curvatus]
MLDLPLTTLDSSSENPDWLNQSQRYNHSIIQVLRYDSRLFALSCTGRMPHETRLFEPATVLLHVVQGEMQLDIHKQIHVIRAGEYGLLRKFTPARTVASVGPSEAYPVVYGFILQDEFIHRFAKPSSKVASVSSPYVDLPATALLDGFMQSIQTYVDQNQSLSRTLIDLKTQEALFALIQMEPNLQFLLHEYAVTQRTDLSEFMHRMFLYNLPLAELARQSGRSLSTFNREFRFLFGQSPHRWLMKQRLDHAYHLLQTGQVRPAELYWQVGFEDLPHFSRAFKKQFHQSPSQVFCPS